MARPNPATTEELLDAIMDLASNFDVPLTNNFPRMYTQTVMLHEAGEFAGAVMDLIRAEKEKAWAEGAEDFSQAVTPMVPVGVVAVANPYATTD